MMGDPGFEPTLQTALLCLFFINSYVFGFTVWESITKAM